MTRQTEEALVFGRYLLQRQPDNCSLALYEQAVAKLSLVLTPEDEQLLQFMLRRPWSIGLIDAGLALLNPHSQVRRKIFVMLAILETQPQYAHLFLPQARGFSYFLSILWIGFRASGKAALGILLVKGLRSWRYTSA
jgi:hypothetical protein